MASYNCCEKVDFPARHSDLTWLRRAAASKFLKIHGG
jgi:hypothetical protein